jgi:hypothetical protein
MTIQLLSKSIIGKTPQEIIPLLRNYNNTDWKKYVDGDIVTPDNIRIVTLEPGCYHKIYTNTPYVTKILDGSLYEFYYNMCGNYTHYNKLYRKDVTYNRYHSCIRNYNTKPCVSLQVFIPHYIKYTCGFTFFVPPL